MKLNESAGTLTESGETLKDCGEAVKGRAVKVKVNVASFLAQAGSPPASCSLGSLAACSSCISMLSFYTMCCAYFPLCRSAQRCALISLRCAYFPPSCGAHAALPLHPRPPALPPPRRSAHLATARSVDSPCTGMRLDALFSSPLPMPLAHARALDAQPLPAPTPASSTPSLTARRVLFSPGIHPRCAISSRALLCNGEKGGGSAWTWYNE